MRLGPHPQFGIGGHVLVVVGVRPEHLAVRARASNQSGEVLGDGHEATAVVAQVEDQFIGALLLQFGKGRIEGGEGGLDKVSENRSKSLKKSKSTKKQF